MDATTPEAAAYIWFVLSLFALAVAGLAALFENTARGRRIAAWLEERLIGR